MSVLRTAALRTAAVLAAVLPALGACIVIDAGGDAAPALPASEAARNEPIYGAWFNDDGFNVRIHSNGCTTKETVRIEIDRHDRGAELTVVRTRPDLCKALVREGVVLTWTLEEIGASKDDVIAVQNGMIPW